MERCPAVVERDISRKVDWTWRPISSPSRSSDPTPMGFLLWGRQKGHDYAVPPRTVEKSRSKTTPVTTVDTIMLRCARENAVLRTSVCLAVDGGCFQHLLQCFSNIFTCRTPFQTEIFPRTPPLS
jgi:hypothetical protein